MASLFFKRKQLFARSTHCMVCGSDVYDSLFRVLSVQKQNRIRFYRILIISDAKTMETLKIDDVLQKLKKVVRIVPYGLAISQSDCRKADPYQLPYVNGLEFSRC